MFDDGSGRGAGDVLAVDVYALGPTLWHLWSELEALRQKALNNFNYRCSNLHLISKSDHSFADPHTVEVTGSNPVAPTGNIGVGSRPNAFFVARWVPSPTPDSFEAMGPKPNARFI